jgi:enoyl-CoA hydratase
MEVTQMTDYEFLKYETFDDGAIARILLNRPEFRNAQNKELLQELGDAFLRSESDDRVRVVILGGVGKSFSSGHDLAAGMPSWFAPSNGGTRKGAEKLMLMEWHTFLEDTRRWRNLRKVTIAQVQGPVYAAGLMIMWCCDLILAADNTRFADVIGTRLGMCGAEYFAHPWEFGARKTKELMLTGDAIDVEEAYRLGMVSKVFPVDELEERTLDFARRIATVPTMTALLVKECVNQTQDIMGLQNALNACFTLHELNHAHWAQLHGDEQSVVALPEDGVPEWTGAPPIVLSTKDMVRSS